MPAIITCRGKKRVRASVMVDGTRKYRLFPDASKDAQRAASKWESETKAELKKDLKNNSGLVLIKTWMLDYLTETKKIVTPKTFEEKQRVFNLLA